ncbi:hypothetical protein BDU57DRAFT_543149 [Ampelomyces quisqualis]|uniref:Uncharacterized protein n=1 Tax=Ampelomyces quisqualis TaxID=50730 RepID=A0A6A5Q874_AMPQU|nr:hypothetical protein BDU57DRAFT_543149 [Ampelomyces quisqualis]
MNPSSEPLWHELSFPKKALSPATRRSQMLQMSLALSIIQVVKQVNFGPLESKRYFAQIKDDGEFVEVTEQWLVTANFQKLNTFKNYKCGMHKKFFEVNVYQRDPVNVHHWRADIARPASDIDL